MRIWARVSGQTRLQGRRATHASQDNCIPVQWDHVYAFAVEVLNRVAPLHGSAVPGVAISSFRKLVRVLAVWLLRVHFAAVRRTQGDGVKARSYREKRAESDQLHHMALPCGMTSISNAYVREADPLENRAVDLIGVAKYLNACVHNLRHLNPQGQASDQPGAAGRIGICMYDPSDLLHSIPGHSSIRRYAY